MRTRSNEREIEETNRVVALYVSLQHPPQPHPPRILHLKRHPDRTILHHAPDPLPCPRFRLAFSKQRPHAVRPKQGDHDGHELDLGELPARADVGAVGPGEEGAPLRLREGFVFEFGCGLAVVFARGMG